MPVKQKVALIFGITGQDGSYLTEILLKKGYVVHGVIRRASTFNTSRINHLYQDPHKKGRGLFLHHGDLADAGTIRKIINKVKPNETYNLAAQSVAGECLCPILSAQKLEYRTLEDLWDEQIKKQKKVRTEKMGAIKVEIIDLPNSKQLRALGMWNGMGTFFPIKQISRHKWNGKVAKLSQKFGSVIITPNHSVIDVTGKICHPSENPWLLNVRKLNYQPGKYRKSISLKLDGVYKFDNKYFWLDENGAISKVLRKVEGNTLKSFCRFVGAFVAEGHTSFNKANKNWYVGISSNNKEWLKGLESDLKKFYIGKCWYINHKKGNFKDVWELQIKSRVLYNLLRKLLGENSKTKQLPYWFSQIEAEFLEEIWRKMCEGDGCINPGTGFRYTTSSYKLACQLGLLFTLLGYDYTVNEENNKNTKHHSIWHFRECTTYQPNQGNSKKLEWIDYNGWVYDITVDEVQNFAVGVGNIVVHNSHVKVSFDIPEYTMDITGNGALRILEAIRDFQSETGKKIKFYQASSSEMFGAAPPPQNENTPFVPQSPYGAAKVFACNMTKLYREAYGIFAVNGILFNHESERRGETFVTRKITRGIARIKAGLDKKLYLGNLDAKRDWGYAPEFCEAMWLMMQQPKPDDFVIGTGETHTVKEFVELSFREAGLDNWKKYVEIDPRYYRPTEVNYLVANTAKAKRVLKWQPKTKFKDLVKIMVWNDINAVKSSSSSSS